MSIGSMSTALIPYTPPKNPMEFIKSEVERGLSNGSISREQLTPRLSIPFSLPDLINLNLSDIAKIFSGSSDIRDNSLVLSRKIGRQSIDRSSRMVYMDFEMPLFLSSDSVRNYSRLPFASEHSLKMFEDLQKLMYSLKFDSLQTLSRASRVSSAKKYPYKTNLTKALASKIFSTSCSKPLMPFKVVKYIFSTHTDSFIKEVLLSAGESKDFDFDGRLTTSCVNNVWALGIIFLGGQQTLTKMKNLTRITKVELFVILPSGKKWNYYVSNLFGGNIIYAMHKDSDFDKLDQIESEKKMQNYVSSYVRKFFAYTDPIITSILAKQHDSKKDDSEIIQELKEAYGKINYSFNESVIESLEEEILNNDEKITIEKSIVYFIGITGPSKKVGVEFNFDHSFVIEQFFYEKKQRAYFRIYQSWINQATLLDDMRKQGYGDQEEGVWGYHKLLEFLNKLKELYCRKTKLPESVTYQDCFGYDEDGVEDPPLLTFDGQTLTGLSLRYFSQEIAPDHCLKNLTEFVSLHPELQSKFCN